jgi:hypothetical protein
MKAFKIIIFDYLVLLSVFCLLMLTNVCKSQGLNIKGQLSSWGTANRNQNEWNGNSGIRYIPQFDFSYSLDENDLLNAEVLFNIHYSTDFRIDDYAFKTYRAILRYTTEQTETQIGLQKINFGPAQLLRPLKWFDRVDPRDPLKITDGVYGLRYKYSFLDNSLLWLWCLYGNKENIGYELFHTAKNTLEFGGRVQLPILEGEIAATFHTRKVDAMIYNYRENRYALDGRWDFGIGVWFESVLQNNISNSPFYKWNRMSTIGADYTIPEGSGIYILAEHLNTAFSNSFWNTDLSRQISAIMITYSLNMLDNISLQEYYDWDSKNFYHYFQFQRTYDDFIINFALFYYPESSVGLFLNNKTSLLLGYGLQLMLIYNY